MSTEFQSLKLVAFNSTDPSKKLLEIYSEKFDLNKSFEENVKEISPKLLSFACDLLEYTNTINHNLLLEALRVLVRETKVEDIYKLNCDVINIALRTCNLCIKAY